MRVMQSPWGPPLMVGIGILGGLLLLSFIFVLIALGIFLLRRSRPAVLPAQQNTVNRKTGPKSEVPAKPEAPAGEGGANI